jgi:ribonuclease HI
MLYNDRQRVRTPGSDIDRRRMTAQHPSSAQQATFSDPAIEPPPPAVVVYTDGGCDPNPGLGGWAAVLVFVDHEVILQGNDPQTTNNRMEMEAAIAALAYLQGRHGACRVDVHTDSTYLRRGIRTWVKRWVANGWQTLNEQPVKNQALWRALYDLSQVHHVRWHWVKGHAGNPLNERVDLLATQARARLFTCQDLDAAREELPPPGEVPPPAPMPGPADLLPVTDLPRGAPVGISIAVSCPGSKGPGKWAALLHSGEARAALSGREAQTTGNLIHLQAATAALQTLPAPAEVTVYTTSDYLARGASEWLPGWQRGGWRTGSGKPVANREQWQALHRAASHHHVTWQVVRGDSLPEDLVEAKRLVQKEGIRELGN